MFGKGLNSFLLLPHCFLNPSLTSPDFYMSTVQILWKHCGKKKSLTTSNFSFSHSVLYLFRELSIIFIKFEIVICNLFQFRRVYNLSFWKGLIVPFFQIYLVPECFLRSPLFQVFLLPQCIQHGSFVVVSILPQYFL